MENRNQRNQNSYFWVGIIIFFAFMVLIQFVRGSVFSDASVYTMGEFESDLAGGNVVKVVVAPNRETPTGAAQITLEDGDVRTLFATDISVIETMARDAGLDPVVSSSFSS